MTSTQTHSQTDAHTHTQTRTHTDTHTLGHLALICRVLARFVFICLFAGFLSQAPQKCPLHCGEHNHNSIYALLWKPYSSQALFAACIYCPPLISLLVPSSPHCLSLCLSVVSFCLLSSTQPQSTVLSSSPLLMSFSLYLLSSELNTASINSPT